MGKTVNIPISFLRSPLQWTIKKKFIDLKLGEPIIRIADCRYTRNQMKSLLALRWVSTDGEYYYMRSWRRVARLIGFGGRYVKVPRDLLSRCPQETFFAAATHWHLKIQPDRPLNAQRANVKGLIQFTEDNHGVSLRLMAKFFDKSHYWASKMRRKCEDQGLLKHSRRYTPIGELEYRWGVRCAQDTGSGFGGFIKTIDGRFFRELASRSTVKCDFSYGRFWKLKRKGKSSILERK